MSATNDAQPVVSDAEPAWYHQRRRVFDDALAAHLKSLKSAVLPHSDLLDAVCYSMAAGGKRLRPILVLEAARLCGGHDGSAMRPAIAVECVHAFSLIHDDLPAMDDDDLRRGRPTCHKAFSEASAILAGDWLLSHAFQLLAEEPDPNVAIGLVRGLALGAVGMVEGQAADVCGESAPPAADLVEFIHLQKTARLIEACCRLGAITARVGCDEVEVLGRFGRLLGLAFQIADDLLDERGDAARTGKRVAKDAGRSKQTYPAVYGLRASEELAREQVETAISTLHGFGPRADRLRELARYVILRDR
jgi:geranylgeranyl pyrophosphate synthase